MTSRDFNGTTSVIQTINAAAKTDSPWSCAVWAIWDTAGETSIGHFFFADTNALRFRMSSASTAINVRQATSSTAAEIVTSAPSFQTGVWYCLVATYDGPPSGSCHLYYGTPNGPMAECTYSTNTAANATATTWGTTIYVGNNSGSSGTFDGRLLHTAVLDWVMDRSEMERYRTGDMSVLFTRGNPRAYFTMCDGNAGIDSSRRNQSVSNTSIATTQDMPGGVVFDWDFARNHPLRRPVVTSSTQNVAMDFVTNTPTVYSPTITVGSVSVAMNFVTNTPTVFTPGVLYTQTAVLPLVTNTPTVLSPSASVIGGYPMNEGFPGASGAPSAQWTTSVVGTGTVALDTDRLKMVIPALNDASRALLSNIIPANSELQASITYTVGTNQSVAFNFRSDGTWVASAGGTHLPQNGLVLAPSVLGDQVKLFTVVASVATQLGSTYNLTIGATDTVRLRASMTGTAVFWKAWIDGTLPPTEWQTATDSNHSARTRLSLAALNPTSSSATLYWDDIVANDKGSTQNVVCPLVTNVPTVFAPIVTLSAAPFSDTFTGTNSDPWPAIWTTGTDGGAGTVVDLQSNKGRMRTGTVANGKVYARNAAAFASGNYTLAVDITIPAITEWFYFVHVRGATGVLDNHVLASSYQIRYALITGVLYSQLYEVDASGNQTFRASMGPVSGTPGVGDTVHMAIEVSGTGTTTLLAKAYKVGTSDPGYTDLSSSVTTAYTGSYFLLSVQGGTDALTDDFLWDDFSVTINAQNVAMNFVTDTVTVFNPTVTTTVGVVLPLVTNVPTVYSPSILATQTMQLPRVNNVPTVFAPSILATQTMVLPLVTNNVNVFNPTVTRGGVTVVLPLVTNIPTVFSPAASNATQTISVPIVYVTTSDLILDTNGLPILDTNGLPLRDGSAGVFAPTLIFYSVTMQLVVNEPVVFAPTVIASNVTVVLPLVTNTSTAFAPTTQSLIALPLVDSTPTVFDPSIRGTQTTVLPLVTNVPTVFAPSIATEQTIVLPLVVSDQVVFAPVVQPTLLPVLPLVTNVPTVFAPTVLVTNAIVMERVVNTATVFAPSVISGTTTILMDFVVNVTTVFAPEVGQGVYTFLPPHDENGPRQLSELGRRRAGVSWAANHLAGFYGAPRSFSVLKINGTYRQIQGPTMEQVNASTEYYAGGHEYDVDYPTAVALQAAGFDVQGV